MTDEAKPVPTFSRTKTFGALPIEKNVERDEGEMHEKKKYQIIETIAFAICITAFEIFMCAMWGVWFFYPEDPAVTDYQVYIYPFARDVSIMIFFGFGFLMAFLRRYGYSAIGYAFLIGAMASQWSILCGAFFITLAPYDGHTVDFSVRYGVGVFDILNALFASAAVMISFGAFLGKSHPTQLVVMTFIEIAAYWTNLYIVLEVLEAHDIGGGMTIHTFGACFGIALARFMTSKNTRGHPDNQSAYVADVLSMSGTMFLWIMWPSFNAVLAEDSAATNRALVNTFVSLCGATVVTFAMSRIFAEMTFEPVHIQNSTLAGGVMMGTAADLQLYPAVALGCGIIAGIVSVLGYRFSTPLLNNYLWIQDICGIWNLHGMPGILSAWVAIIALIPISIDCPSCFPRHEFQPLFNLAGLGVTIAIAVLAGIGTGIILFGLSYLNRIWPEDFFNDRTFWVLPSDYDWVARDEDEE